jgi:hypothetical protein
MFFVQLSGSQWGIEGDPDAQGTLQKAVTAVNSLAQQPTSLFSSVSSFAPAGNQCCVVRHTPAILRRPMRFF